MLDRINAMKINTVYITAYSDTDHDGYADAVYFPSRYLPTRADILNRVSWQIETRAGDPNRINVHMVMPVTAFKNQHGRLTEKEIIELYGDVAKFSYTEGILFVDEKGEGTTSFLKKLVNKVKYYRSRVKNTALLLSDQRVLIAKNQTQFWPDLQAKYNSFVIKVDSGFQSPEQHIDSVLNALPGNKNLKNFVFELQTVNKQTGEKIPANILSSEVDFLLQKKVLQFSHFPDDVAGNHPPLELIRSKVSVNDFPFGN
jgi:biofilm PGA synthesis lipoprotein PgaB